MEGGLAWLIVIVVNVLISYKGFNDQRFFNAWTFEVDKVLKKGEWYRIITSGFLHVSGTHLAFNMITLYFFAGNIESYLGPWAFLIIYFGSLIGGNLFSLFVHLKNDLYRAVGASGAVSGIVFAAIALFPGMKLAFIFIPVPFPAWIYGLGFILYSIYGIRSQRDNIGHEAHLGGAILGLLIAILYQPSVLEFNQMAILLILVPTVVFVIVIIYKPKVLMIDQKYTGYMNQDDEYRDKVARQKERLNLILEKVNRNGVESLNQEERDILEDYADRK